MIVSFHYLVRTINQVWNVTNIKINTILLSHTFKMYLTCNKTMLGFYSSTGLIL
jgi:hypothetical protein